jgi:uncharacterized protein YaiL (DUF2058 family)
MSMSLRDQLLKAGLVTEQQAKEAERQAGQQQRHKQKQQPKDKRDSASAAEVAARQAQAAKVARDQELARRQKELADAKARQAQVDQLIEQHRLPRAETDERYNFTVGGKIRRIAADAALRGRILRGEVVIVRGSAGYALVPAEAAERIRERNARSVVVWLTAAAPAAAKPAEDDPYKGFEVPDDLMW